MTTRNTDHAKVLASIASQVVDSYRNPDHSLNRNRSHMANAMNQWADEQEALDPSWQYTLPKEYRYDDV